MTDRETLAARIEAATGPDRELDIAIYQMLNPHMLPIPGDAGRFYDPAKTNPRTAQKFFLSGGATGVALRYTASIDAAMMLVPEGYYPLVDFYDKSVTLWSFKDGKHHEATFGNGQTVPLSLAAAAIRAGGV